MIIGLKDGCGYNCEDEGWSVENIRQCQKISDVLIALAYSSIPLEILYFVSCSRAFPYRWVLFQFGAFIVLCGLTHFLNVWTYNSPNFPVMFALTIFKAFTAFVSSATAITLATLIPQLLRVKVREGFLKNKAMELNRAVGFLKKREEASWHVRMLTQEIRSSLDRHTILNTTLIELSKVLNLDNCAIWMPSEDGTVMELTHELKSRLLQERIIIPITNPDVMEIKSRKTVVILKPDSALGKASVQQGLFPGPTAAIRIPMLKVSNFNGGTPELIDASYAILVLVLPSEGKSVWIPQALDIVEVVAGQIAVALSHAAVLEESQQMRNRLADQNKALQRARVDAMMASQAHNSFQREINHQARVPMHCIYGLSSILQVENWKIEQQPLVEMLASSSNILCTTVLDALLFEANTLRLELHSFHFPAMLEVAVRLAKFVCVSKGLQFVTDIDVGIPSHVIGDEKHIMQIISHTVENVSNCIKKGTVSLQVSVQNKDDGSWDQKNPKRRPSMCEGFVNLRFEVRCTVSGLEEAYSSRLPNVLKQDDSYTPSYNGAGLGFHISKQIVQLMHGNMWIEIDSHGVVHFETFVIRVELQKTSSRSNPQLCADQSFDSSAFRGLKAVVADDNTVNCAVTQRLLQRLGCEVAVTHSGYQCLKKLFESGSGTGTGTVYQLVLVEVCMADMDGRDVTFLIHQKFSGGNRPLVIALTAHTDKVTLDRCFEMGMDGIIWKPVSLNEMRRELSKIMQKSMHHISSSTSCG